MFIVSLKLETYSFNASVLTTSGTRSSKDSMGEGFHQSGFSDGGGGGGGGGGGSLVMGPVHSPGPINRSS